MKKTLLFDFSRVILFAKDKKYKEDLNPLNKMLLEENPNYDFLDYFKLNTELLNFLESVKDKFELYIFTSGSIQNSSAIKSEIDKVFKAVFSAEELGLSKKDPSSYIEIAKKIGRLPQDILFIDDSEANVAAASKAGLDIFKYEDNQKLFDRIKST